MKKPNDYASVNFRLGKDLEQSLSERVAEQSQSAYSAQAKQDLTDYYTLLSLSLPTFSEQDRAILFQSLKDWLATPETVHLLWAEVEASQLADDEMVARLRRLSRFECWAIANAVRYGWEG